MTTLRLLVLGLMLALALASPALAHHKQGHEHGPMGKITICHATGSETNPFVEITVNENATIGGHGNHENDIIPAPAGGCSTDVIQPTPPPPSLGGDQGGAGGSNTQGGLPHTGLPALLIGLLGLGLIGAGVKLTRP